MEALGPWRLLRVVAGDGGVTVYEAFIPGDMGRAALHVLAPVRGGPLRQDGLARLRNAVRDAVGLRHPNLVAPRECGCEDGTVWVATEFVEGERLPAYMARAGRLPALQGLALVAQLLSALEYAHDRGRVHGAIHPGHLLVARNGRVKLDGTGWMAAAMAGARRPSTFDDADYLAPEIARGSPADRRSDVYAAAVVAYELLAGRLPFADGARAPLPLRDARPQLPAALDAVFAQALSVRPELRYASATELGEALGAAFGQPLWARQAPQAAQALPVAVSGLPAFAHESQLPAIPADAPRAPAARRVAVGIAAVLTACVFWLGSLLNDGGQEMSTAPPPPAATGTPVTTTTADPAPPLASSPAAAPAMVLATDPAPAVAPVTPVREAAPVAPAARSATTAPPPRPRADEPRVDAGPKRPAASRDERVNAPERRGAVMGASRAAPARDVEDAPEPGRRVATKPRPREGHATAVPSSRVIRASVATPALECRGKGMAFELCLVIRCATSEYRHHPLCERLHAEGSMRRRQAEARVVR